MSNFDPFLEIFRTDIILIKIRTSPKLSFDTIINKFDLVDKKLLKIQISKFSKIQTFLT